MGGFQHGVPCTWQLPWLAVEKPWSALAGPFLTLLAQTGSGTTPPPTTSGLIGSIQSGGGRTGQRAVTN